jgi:hypothetical protein
MLRSGLASLVYRYLPGAPWACSLALAAASVSRETVGRLYTTFDSGVLEALLFATKLIVCCLQATFRVSMLGCK